MCNRYNSEIQIKYERQFERAAFFVLLEILDDVTQVKNLTTGHPEFISGSIFQYNEILKQVQNDLLISAFRKFIKNQTIQFQPVHK